MRTKLDLFFKWGIELNEAYEPDKQDVREVHYAGKDELIAEIERKEGILRQTTIQNRMKQAMQNTEADEPSFIPIPREAMRLHEQTRRNKT